MRESLRELVCCPRCSHFPLDLTVIEYSASDGVEPRDVETGFFRCPECARFYFIVTGIARLLTEDFSQLIDTSLVAQHPDVFRVHGEELASFISLLEADRPAAGLATWGLEDVAFWEEEYGRSTRQDSMLEQVQRSRPDAGNRMYPREVTIFRRLRPLVRDGGTLLDLGCGAAQAVRTLCHPRVVGCRYIGCDLALNALLLNRRTLDGDYVQCSAEQPPFRPGWADGLIMLGALHHLSDPGKVMGLALQIVRPGGAVGVHEVTGRSGIAKRLGSLCSGTESPHDDSVDLGQLRERLRTERTRGVMRFGGSPVRALLAARISERMRTSPVLTRVVLALDALCINTLGRVVPFFGPREVVIFAQKPEAPARSGPSEAVLESSLPRPSPRQGEAGSKPRPAYQAGGP